MKNKAGIKRKLLTDRQLPTPEQVNRRQDFSRVNSNYALIKKVMLKNALLWGGGIIGLAGIATAVLLLHPGKPQPQPAAPPVPAAIAETHTSCILPPLPASDTPFSSFSVSAKDGATIRYKTGSTITIPANAFRDADGNTIGDSVTIRYREFHDVLDIFLSGIPMNYDSAGTHYTLESAGMLEIRAYQGNKPLQLDPGKPVTISLASNTADKKFNLYELDTISKNWVYKGKDQVTENAKAVAATVKTGAPAVASPAGNLVKPALSDPQKYCFRIAYDKTDFPELAAYDNVLFEVTDNAFRPVYYKINWKSISLENSSTKGTYFVKLHKADTTITVSAVPVFDREHYETALRAFDEKQKAAGSRQHSEEAAKQARLDDTNRSLKGYKTKDFSNALQLTAAKRTFTVLRFGLFNCDHPLLPLPVQTVAPVFQDGAAKETYSTVFLAEKGKNTVFRFTRGERFRFDPHAEHLLWTIDSNNRVAFFRNVDYAQLATGNSAIPLPAAASSQDAAFAEIRNFSRP